MCVCGVGPMQLVRMICDGYFNFMPYTLVMCVICDCMVIVYVILFLQCDLVHYFTVT